MRYGKVVQGRFLSRPNRFIALVELNGAETVCHVKNTGRCRELLRPGAAVYLERSGNPSRKTAFDLIAVDKDGLLVNMDAQAPNRVFGEFARTFDPTAVDVKPEFVYGASRLDFCLTTPAGLHLVEVKGVTLEENGHARFPDAPTERGVKHLWELIRAKKNGSDAGILFIIQMKGVSLLRPNRETHPAFADALREAAEAGVQLGALDCRVLPGQVEADCSVPIELT